MEAFGGFVMQGNVVIGLIVFLILTIINFVVITKGSGRIAEVAARFSLDAMPGKQMAIDADLAAGIIDDNTAKEKRKEIESESNFYGAMDGANKFVRGDAIAGLIITFINLIGGIIVGVAQKNLSFNSAIKTYTILTIGDGLVSQIPSLVISMAAGLLVTRSGSNETAGTDIIHQLSKYPQALLITGILTSLMAFLPGLPFMPFFIITCLIGYVSYIAFIRLEKEENNLHENNGYANNNPSSENRMDSFEGLSSNNIENNQEDTKQMPVLYPISIEIGYNLIEFITDKNSKLANNIQRLRSQFIEDYGFNIPKINVQDSIFNDMDSYNIKIKNIIAGSSLVRMDKIMVINNNGGEINIKGEKVTEPAFGIEAKWIDREYRNQAMLDNLNIVEPHTVIVTHLSEIIKENISELLSYSLTKEMVDNIEKTHPDLIKDTIPEVISIDKLQKILCSLLEEKVSIRDLPTIIEASAEGFRNNRNIIDTIEIVRRKLSRQISLSNVNKDGVIDVIQLSKEWEQNFINSFVVNENGKILSMAPSMIQQFVDIVKEKLENSNNSLNANIVILTNSYIRYYVKSIIEKFLPSCNVMSQEEIYHKTKINTVDII
ncbi:MAG TPA: flagellar biosynthesis protein FlhA [Candidatus Megaira endosymbiont of Hartmannula sinica]|nr:flagellar biosynthesis protein FlhA [Candidatus Megaera endosymbiont of Hartmannula sinica]